MLACWIEDPNSEAFKLHIPRVYDYLWVAEDGMKMQVSSTCLVVSYAIFLYFFHSLGYNNNNNEPINLYFTS